jgi:hypothetical protein
MFLFDFLARNKDVLDALVQIAFLLGIPLSIWIYYDEKKKERTEREYGTYDALDDKYIYFLQLCLENSDLDLMWDIPMKEKINLTPERKRRQDILFSLLISILERAFLMYRDQSTQIKRKQWSGWSEYMRQYLLKANFRQTWIDIKDQWDEDFVSYMDNLFKETENMLEENAINTLDE